MAPVAAAVANAGICAPQHKRPARELDRAGVPQFGTTVVRSANSQDLRSLLELAQTLIGQEMASEDVVRRITVQRPDSLWAFLRDGQLVGGLAMLMLNARGLEALLAGCIDAQDPPMGLISKPAEVPAAIYLWGGAHSSASDGMLRMWVRLQSAPYESADIFAVPVTMSGLRFVQRWGFQPIPHHPRNLFRYIRITNRRH
jgi:hypothetical protein